MPKYRILLNGRNFWMNLENTFGRFGFYTWRYVEAPTPEEAERLAVDVVRGEETLRSAVLNASSDPRRSTWRRSTNSSPSTGSLLLALAAHGTARTILSSEPTMRTVRLASQRRRCTARWAWGIALSFALLGCPRLPTKGQSGARGQGFQSAVDVSQWMMHYYEAPSPERLVPAIECMSKDGRLLDSEKNQATAAFFGRLFAQNSRRLDGWITHFTAASEDQRFFVALAIWYADMARKADLLRTLSHGSDSLAQFSKELQGDRPPDLLTVEITEPVQLDILWAQFFATGDPRYVERIISVLPYAAPGEHSGRLVIGLAARWSLTSNATQQARVMEICSKAARSANPQLQPLLQEVLNAARNTPRRAGRSEAQPEAR